MYWIDEVRVRSMIAQNNFKERLATFFIKIACFFAREHIKKMCVGKNIEIELESHIPNDEKWHHVAMTVEYWIKLSKDFKQDHKDETILYIDGKREM